jgi:DNA-binding transcriptional LysR family regulator
MQTLRGILNFARVAELGSFVKAAEELGISPVAVSQNISRLEKGLGVRLLARSTRHLQLTADGQAFLEQCRQPLAELDLACAQVASSANEAIGKVRATVASPVGALYLVPILDQFYARYPGIELDLELSEEANPLIKKRFDVGIRVGSLNDAGFVARPLGPVRMLLCASPKYLQAKGIPKSLDELQSHQMLMMHISGQEHPSPVVVQTLNEGARNIQVLQFKGRFVCNDFRSLCDASVAGLGICQLPQPLALASLKSGALQHVLADNIVEGLQLFVHYPSRKQLPARVRAFVDFVIEHLGGHADLTADVSTYRAG